MTTTPPTATLEHVNLTVSDITKTAHMLCTLFDWEIRWQGDSIDDGTSIHVGHSDMQGGDYVAIYQSPKPRNNPGPRNNLVAGLNHLGILVKDLDKIEARIIAAGYKPFSHRDYAPGKRFYFLDEDEVEYEIISYAD